MNSLKTGTERSLFPSILAAGVGAELAYLAMVLRGGLSRGAYLGFWAAAFACYGLAVYRISRDGSTGTAQRLILGFAVLFRITLLFTPPALSDDVYRYIWDGRVQLAGINPYLHAPASPEMSGFDEPLLAAINHPEVPTIYPPLSQALFLAVTAVSTSVWMMKLVFTLCELGVILLVCRLLKILGRRPAGLLWYAWNPLAIVEVAGNGHNDSFGALLLVLAVLLILQKRTRLSIAALAASAGAKLVGISFLPFFLAAGGRAGRWRRIGAGIGIAFLSLTLFWLPYRSAGWSMFTGLRTYVGRWRGNDFLFSLVLGCFERIDLTARLKTLLQRFWTGSGDSPVLQFLYRHVHPIDLAKGTVFLALLGVLIFLMTRRIDLPRKIFILLGWSLLLTPTLHPWYLLWILPFAALYGNAGWILFSGLAILFYLPAAAEGVTALRLAQYLPLFALLGLQYYLGRRRRRNNAVD